jgi:hypothetical protein
MMWELILSGSVLGGLGLEPKDREFPGKKIRALCTQGGYQGRSRSAWSDQNASTFP